MTRGDKAKEYFLEGYNCAQAVALAYSDYLEMDKDAIARLISGFGGGMGRMREVCGAVSGAVFVMSMLYGYSNPKDNDTKMDLYSKIQKVGADFKNENGSIVCRELLELQKKGFDSPTPEARTGEYYKKRPCPELVKSSADLLEQFIGNNPPLKK